MRLLAMILAATLAAGAWAADAANVQPPKGWSFFNPSNAYDVGPYRDDAGGKEWVAIQPRDKKPFVPNSGRFGILYQSFDAQRYRDKRVRLSVEVAYEEIDLYGTVWIRSDRSERDSTWYNTDKEALTFGREDLYGSGDGQRIAVVVNIPKRARVVTMGFALYGNGSLRVREPRFETVGKEVPVTSAALRKDPDLGFGYSKESKARRKWLRGDPLDARVTVHVKNAPLASFLDSVSEQAKVNFIIRDEVVKKRVTVFLKNVKVREVLELIAKTKGLTWERIGTSNTYVIGYRNKSDTDIDALAREIKALRKEISRLKAKEE